MPQETTARADVTHKSPYERDILVAAEAEARRVLDESRDKADQILIQAQAAAMELLLRQRDLAARLLIEDEATAEATKSAAEHGDVGLSTERRQEKREDRAREAAFLRDRQQRAAEQLRSKQVDDALRKQQAQEVRSVDILLEGRKRAAEILGEAVRRVVDERRGD